MGAVGKDCRRAIAYSSDASAAFDPWSRALLSSVLRVRIPVRTAAAVPVCPLE